MESILYKMQKKIIIKILNTMCLIKKYLLPIMY